MMAPSSPAEVALSVLELARAGQFAQIRDMFAPPLQALVPYSEVNASAPRTVTGSTAYSAKARKLPASGSTGLPAAEAAGPAARLTATMAVTPSVTTAAMRRVQ
jgi:hypothetical protein